MRIASPLRVAAWLAAAAAIFAGPTAHGQIGPDSYGYKASSVSSSFEDISFTGTRIPVVGSAVVVTGIPIGFDYTFYGRAFHKVGANGFGFLQFGGGIDQGGASGSPLTQLSPPPFTLDLPTICVLWNRWWVTTQSAPSSGVYYQTLGAAPNRRFIVQWNELYGGRTPFPVTFEAVLFERSDKILFRYGNMDTGGFPTFGQSCIVGIRDAGAGGGGGGRVLQWSGGEARMNTGDAIQFSASDTDVRVTGISPPEVPVYNGETTIQVFGRNFSDGDTVQLVGYQDLDTTYVSPSELDAVIPESYCWSGATYAVGVGASNTVQFCVGPPAPLGLLWQNGLGAGHAGLDWCYDQDLNPGFKVQIHGPNDSEFQDFYGSFSIYPQTGYYQGDIYDLTPEVVYSLRLVAMDASDYGTPSDPVDFIAGLYNVTGLKATSAGPNELDLSWTNHSTMAQILLIGRMHAVYDANGKVAWNTGAWDFFQDNIPASTTSYPDTTVHPGGLYRYFVQAQINSYTTPVGRTVTLSSNSTTLDTGHLAPLAHDDTYQANSGQWLTVNAPGILGNDYKSDSKLTLTAIQVAGPSHGQVILGGDGSFQYKPDNGFAGKDTFTYKANDATIDSNVATVTVNVVAGPNNSPTADNQAVTTPQDTPVAITLTGSDPDGDAITYTVTTNPSHGALSGTAPNVSYKPSTGYYGQDSFQFKVTDSHGADSVPATVSITVVGKPTAFSQNVATTVDTPVAITLVGLDPNTPARSLTYTVTANPTNGILTGTAPDVTYKPNAGYYGPDTFQFKVSNGTLDSDAATVSIQVSTPAPTLASIDPISVLAGAGDVTITLTGGGFVSGSQAKWNGTTSLATTYVSTSVLAAVVPASLTATGTSASITVVNPPPGGGTSGVVVFTVNNPAPALSMLAPASAPAGTNGLTLTVTGTSFVQGSVVRWNGADRPTTFGSATSVTAAIPASDLQAPGSAAVTVFNPGPGGGTSGPLPFTIGPPEIASLYAVQVTPALGRIKSGLSQEFRMWAMYKMTDGTLTGWSDVTDHGATFSSNGQGRLVGRFGNIYQSATRTPETALITGVFTFKSTQMSNVGAVVVYR